MKYLLPFLLLCVFALAFAKKQNAYTGFIDGAKQALPLAKDLLPYLACMLVAVELAKASGVYNLLQFVFEPLLTLLGIPPQLCQLVVLKPFSGSGSLVMLNDLLLTHGPDSFVGRCACVVYGTSETVFYIATIYFSGTSIKKLGWAMAIGLFCSVLSSALGCLFCRLFFV